MLARTALEQSSRFPPLSLLLKQQSGAIAPGNQVDVKRDVTTLSTTFASDSRTMQVNRLTLPMRLMATCPGLRI